MGDKEAPGDECYYCGNDGGYHATKSGWVTSGYFEPKRVWFCGLCGD